MAKEHPVTTGLLALAGVGLVVGLLVSGAALGATQVLGLGDSSGNGGTATAQQSMYLPTPEPTAKNTEPLVTLIPVPTPEGVTESPGELATPTASAPTISLSASTTAAQPGEKVTLSGIYPGGEGATLVVERFVGGTWADFANITTSVSGQTFSTYIITSQTGENTFRVRDTATNLASNEVKFTIG